MTTRFGTAPQEASVHHQATKDHPVFGSQPVKTLTEALQELNSEDLPDIEGVVIAEAATPEKDKAIRDNLATLGKVGQKPAPTPNLDRWVDVSHQNPDYGEHHMRIEPHGLYTLSRPKGTKGYIVHYGGINRKEPTQTFSMRALGVFDKVTPALTTVERHHQEQSK